MKYDVVVIGSGPGGYVAAIRCAQLGFKTALVEKHDTLGGTCLNVGCIPSKALLDSSEHYYALTHKFKEHGIEAGKISLNWEQMLARKNKVVSDTCKGVSFLMGKNKIDVLKGIGSFIDPHQLQITDDKGKVQKITADKFIIATGSRPVALQGIPFDRKRIISSTEALTLANPPKSLIIIGGGVIGLELGSVYARLGTKVTVVEFLDRIIAQMDYDLSKHLERSLKKLGFQFHLNYKVTGIENKGAKVRVTASGEKELSLESECCLVCVGRTPYLEQLNPEKAGVVPDQKNYIPVNENLQTEQSHIYAIGDVIGGSMLAHKAEEEGVFVAEHIKGQKPHINYNTIPGVVYTWPEVASVGKTEDELKNENRAYRAGSFPYSALGRARASMDIEGLVKVLVAEKDDEILGVHMIGARAADMIAEAVVALEYKASAEDIARICHAHPTFTEAFKEACLAATDNRSIHM